MRTRAGRGLPGPLPLACLTFILLAASPARAGAPAAPRLVLFDDHPAAGSRLQVTGRRSTAKESSDRARQGGAFLRLNLDREEDAVFSLDLERAWVAAALPHPGDLGAWRGEGEIFFWLRAPQGVEGLEIGLGELAAEDIARRAKLMGLKDEEALEVEPRLTLSLADYARGGSSWEAVRIPLRDFKKGYYLWMEGDPAGGMGGRVVRRDWNFHWASVGRLLLLAPAFFDIQSAVDLDQIEIRSLGSGASSPPRRKKGPLPPPDRVLFGDRPASPFWAYGGRLAEVIVDQTVQREGAASALFVMTNRNEGTLKSMPSKKGVARPVTMDQRLAVETQDAWAGMSLPEMDWRPYVAHGSLTFWVRGRNGGEGFGLTLASRHEALSTASAESPDIRSYGDISGDWRRASVPLVDFTREGDFDWGRVVELGFHAPATDELELAWWLDDLRLVGGGDLEGVHPDKPLPSMPWKGKRPWLR